MRFASLCLALVLVPAAASAQPSAPITEVTIGPNLKGAGFVVRGRDARQQLFVTGKRGDGRLTDLTSVSTFKANPAGIVAVDSDGLVTPMKDGKATVSATTKEGKSASISVTVEGYANPLPINFPNQIVPIFTKLGCNSGGCHGKASGQNGFKLSLLGFYPKDDFEFLVKESRGRRVFPAAPENSLLLTKASGIVPHGGGKRMDVGSHEYRLIARWIQQGMPYGKDTDPKVVGIECVPKARIMGRNDTQQVTVVATYSDGTTEDVTRMALFEPNDTEMAECDSKGKVTTLDLAGEVAIMARYQGQVSTFRATVPLGAKVDNLPKAANFIDELVFKKLKTLGIPPSEVCDDATFLRRVYIDITGTTPTEEAVRSFLSDKDPAKRSKLIDKLLETPEYADYFANKWNLVLRNKKRQNGDETGTYAFYRWIWKSIYENKPYDQFVKQILTASGQSRYNPPVIWYREVDEQNEQVEDTAQLFLGVRIQCARCHHHPFEKWSQNDYYSLAAFFSRVGKKNLPGATNRNRERRVFHNEGTASATNPRNKENLKPAGLGDQPMVLSPEKDPRVALADWMAKPNNPFFSKTLVNRYWKHFFSRGIVEPEDDMRETNPPTNPELLGALAKHFVDKKFDLKDLIRTICNSKVYQLSSFPNQHNLKDKQNFSRYYPKRLTAEVLYDAFHRVTDTSQSYSGMPSGTKAIQLPDPSVGPYFLKVFGQPQGDTACECERSQEANLAQSLHLLNSQEVQTKCASGRASRWSGDSKKKHEEKIRELYRWAFARNPDKEELGICMEHINKKDKEKKVKEAYEDLVWALVNCKEFLFNH